MVAAAILNFQNEMTTYAALYRERSRALAL